MRWSGVIGGGEGGGGMGKSYDEERQWISRGYPRRKWQLGKEGRICFQIVVRKVISAGGA